MKLKKAFILPLITFTLAGCSTRTYAYSDYAVNVTRDGQKVEYVDNFKIAQLTDIHWGVEMDYVEEIKHLDKIVETIKSNGTNLIVITGDSFLDANTNLVKKFVEYFDGIGIPWTYTYGNHDLQGTYNYYYINKQIMKSKNAVFIDYQDDDIYGYTNFYINLNKDNVTKYRLYIVDSNCYYNQGLTYGYDVIHQDQLDHMKKIHDNESSAGELVFLHIPLVEYTNASDAYAADSSIGQGEKNEKECPPYMNNGAYDVFKAMGVKGVFSGHDHINTYDINNGEMILSYGLKATDLVYHDERLMGYQEITLPSDVSSFGLNCIKEVTIKYE